MTQQFERLTAEDLDCYRKLFFGITRKFQQFSYSDFYIFNVPKTIRILDIYCEWLLSQENKNFNDLYYKFWTKSDMDITEVSMLLLPIGHDKEQEITRVKRLISELRSIKESYVFNDVRTDSSGLPIKNTIYPATRASLEKVYSISQNENNIEYSTSIKKFFDSYPEPQINPDDLVEFFDDAVNTDLDVNQNN